MVFLFVGIILIISSISLTYYVNSIDNFQTYLTTNQNKDAVLSCIYNNYLNNYNKIHKINLKNYQTDFRLENLYFKIKPGNSVFYTENFNQGLKLKDFPEEQEDLKEFLTKIENCTTNTEYLVYFKDVTYYNNGIVDLPKLNIELYPKNIAKNYEDIVDYINTQKIDFIGKIDISNELNKRFDILKNIMNEIITGITQYAFYKNSNKEKNPFSVKNGIINNNSSILFNGGNINYISPKYIQLNGGQSQFIQSNGVIYIDSYINYCFNKYNKDYEEFKCQGTPDSPVQTTFRVDPATILNYCSSINSELKSTDLYYKDYLNNKETTDLDDFRENIGEGHVFAICASYDNKEYSHVNQYLSDLINLDGTLLNKAFYSLYYINNIPYDINNWTDLNENKTFSLRKGENGWIIYLSENEDFFKNKFNINFEYYVNPFFPDKNFNIFINNSGFDIIQKVLDSDEQKDTQVLKSGSYIEFSLPVTPDIATANENLKFPFGNHVYTKLVEGMIIY